MSRVVPLILMLLAVGCMEPDVSIVRAKPGAKIMKAEISVGLISEDEESGKVECAVRTVNDPSELTRLASYFPGMASGRRSIEMSLTMMAVRIDFTLDNGSKITVLVDQRFSQWTDNLGDWTLRPGLGKIVLPLFADEPRVARQLAD